ncbi:Glycoside hydrolase, 10 [Pyricularia oryzae]|nr:Glycoside hydrolase, 10 [Pyricularia oryzae]KAI6440937.1 Glycoside hydrolase, 10 [Pyricularia oryzae]KAI6490983.1 Glycoside hydrolase, 10 [Pyricularia oryzae]KAI6581556.1 Glycoside hydrolase, 10 [Pyricularia oryzae]KAI6618519.1 Glycoside hydrolase, 10 [Pyricularia oryzae]
MRSASFLPAFIGALLPTVNAQACGLNQVAQAAGLQYFGTAVGEGAVNEQPYMNIVNNINEFGQVVPENGQKWQSTQPNRGQFSYSQGDIVTNVATRNNQVLRCHTLVWHSQLPGWVSSGSWNRQSLEQVIVTHINNVMGHYLGKCYAWDVVNEAIDDNGGWRDSVFYRVFGTDFIPLSFKAAKAADPNTKLYYNDYNLEYNQAKTDRAVELVKIVQAAGAPIDAVGLQGHMIVGSTPSRSALTTMLRRFTALNVDVSYTEVDIRHSSLPASSQAAAQQGVDYANMVGSCLDVGPRCVGFTVWGFTDKHSWIPSTFPGTGDAMLYDANYNKKPAWSSVSSVLRAKATGSGCGPATNLPTTTVATTSPPTSFTTSVTSTTTTAPPQQTTPPVTNPGTVPQWQQCGGINWQGGTVCVSPFRCVKLNDWYYQCLA